MQEATQLLNLICLSSFPETVQEEKGQLVSVKFFVNTDLLLLEFRLMHLSNVLLWKHQLKSWHHHSSLAQPAPCESFFSKLHRYLTKVPFEPCHSLCLRACSLSLILNFLKIFSFSWEQSQDPRAPSFSCTSYFFSAHRSMCFLKHSFLVVIF